MDNVCLTLLRCTPIADIDAHGDVDDVDAAAFVAVLLGSPQNPLHVARLDINGDGTANGADVKPMVQAVMTGG